MVNKDYYHSMRRIWTVQWARATRWSVHTAVAWKPLTVL